MTAIRYKIPILPYRRYIVSKTEIRLCDKFEGNNFKTQSTVCFKNKLADRRTNGQTQLVKQFKA